MKTPLPTLGLEDLHDSRREASAYVLDTIEKVSETVLGVSIPDGTAAVVSAALLGLGTRFGAHFTDPIHKAIAYPLERLSRPRTLTAHFGSTVLVRDAGRYDLVEVLVKAQAALNTTALRLVPTHILFEEAQRNYEWRGTLLEFTLSSGLSRMVPQYVAWHADASYAPAKQKGLAELRVRSIAHKT